MGSRRQVFQPAIDDRGVTERLDSAVDQLIGRPMASGLEQFCRDGAKEGVAKAGQGSADGRVGSRFHSEYDTDRPRSPTTCDALDYFAFASFGHGCWASQSGPKKSRTKYSELMIWYSQILPRSLALNRPESRPTTTSSTVTWPGSSELVACSVRNAT